MSKLNRREFKELLLEWKQNFINERAEAGLSQYIKSKFPIDIVFLSRKITLSDYENFLSEMGISIEREGEANSLYAGMEDMPMSLSFKKTENFKNFMLEEHNKEKLFHSEAHKSQFLNAAGNIDKDMCLLLPSVWDNNITQNDTSNLNWQIHDLFHCFFHMSHGSSFYGDLNPPFDDLKFEEKNDIVPYDSETEGFTGRELMGWLRSINFTPETDTNDITPSLFAWCALKLPREGESADKEINKQELSEKAKSALRQMHKSTYESMDKLIKDFKDKFVYITMSL